MSVGTTDVERSIVIDAPVEAVWPLLVRFESWPSWGPTVLDVESEANEVASGVRGRVRTPVGVWLPFEITEFEANRSWSWKVAGLRATGHRVEPRPDGSTNVVFTAPRFWRPYGTVLSLGLQRLEDLAEQTSEVVPRSAARTGGMQP